MTRWERFAKTKGINKKKRPAMVYEEATGEYKPRFGYGSKNPADDWCLPVPDNSGMYYIFISLFICIYTFINQTPSPSFN